MAERVVIGSKELLQALRELPKRVQSGIENKVIRAASKTVIAKARGLVPVQFGLLKKSLGVKIKRYRGYADAPAKIVAIIGARRGYGKVVGSETLKTSEGRDVQYGGHKADPANYAHLVEYGHGGPHPAAPHPFLVPALEQSNAGNVMREKLSELVQIEASKLNRRT